MESQRPIGAEKVETIATRPIETPAAPKSVPPPRSSVRMMVGGLAVVLAASGVWWIRAHQTTSSNPVTTATTTAPTIKETTTTAQTTPTVPEAPTTATTTAASSSAGETRAIGHLALYGDPGTRVLVDGVSRGTCPLADVAVEPGEHHVRFVFDVTGDKIDTPVSVKAGEHLKLRADFTGATPTVRVQH
jgi:cytoskeletal protein RodZ